VWVLLIVAETISAQSGIGYMTMNAREFLQTDVVLVGILLYALLGKGSKAIADQNLSGPFGEVVANGLYPKAAQS
jgi:ABC-type nitrate/sulfonate/bicarbonate transport system permease component